MKITLAYSPAPRQVREWSLELPSGSTAGQALAASGVMAEFPELAARRLALGVWGKKAGLGQVLSDQDRVEIYRPLRVDPKVARRERFNTQGVKKSGLFAKKRAGAKAGY
ncbi:MAG: RnfH family protein [Polaromonas sp.]|uniref:RnfH family protein n=1 Tax=Polaromonas sp. TaxID=1869339 RepID=UPI0027302C3B|nr:RnfH family protein [Polaromonas sp.]MDP1739527.1 RnfH family protein [Polaromonas sp.]MDP1953070.1 RnfH family protein [Polaromonas sp.]MDP3752957.1 RnfH family protein [Polaromonas sp.]